MWINMDGHAHYGYTHHTHTPPFTTPCTTGYTAYATRTTTGFASTHTPPLHHTRLHALHHTAATPPPCLHHRTTHFTCPHTPHYHHGLQLHTHTYHTTPHHCSHHTTCHHHHTAATLTYWHTLLPLRATYGTILAYWVLRIEPFRRTAGAPPRTLWYAPRFTTSDTWISSPLRVTATRARRCRAGVCACFHRLCACCLPRAFRACAPELRSSRMERGCALLALWRLPLYYPGADSS